MTDSLKFGPEWLRNMSADVTTSAVTTTLNNNSSGMRYPLAEFRYGREEMLSLFDKNNVRVPDILPNFKKLFIDKVQCPLALTPSTEDDMRLWTRPVGITSGGGGGGGGGGGISTRGSSRGGSVDRGRGRGRGTFHPSIVHQRSTSLFDDDGRGAGTVRPSERVWPERNGGTPINNNALVNEIVDWSSSSSGGGMGNTSISSPRKEFSSHNRLTNDNWRRTRLEDDMITTDGWRSASSTSLTRQTSEKWGRSTSWRDEESSQSFDKSSQGDKSKDYPDDLNDDLPEWATEDPHEGGGSFDSTGAFHGSDDELQHHIQKMYRDEHHHRDHHHVEKESSGDDHNMDLGDTINGGMEPISNKSEDNIIPTAVEPSTDESNLLNQSTNSVDRMQKVADDMVEKLIMDDESNSSMSSLHVMQVVEDDLKKIIMTDDLNHGMPGMSDVKSALQQNHEAMRRGPDSSKLLKPDENVIVPPQMSQMPSIIPPPHIPQPVSVIGSDLWFYHDPQGNIQGPFTATEMAEWYRAGYFDENLYLRRQCDARFSSLGELVEMCNGAIPFLASHLLPPVGFPIVHPKVDPIPPQQQQQQSDQSHNRHSPGIATPTKLPGNMMDINYLLQKQQYIMRHQQHAANAANHLVQKLNMEPWNLLPPDQRNKMLEQIAVSQIATPYHPDSLLQQHQQQRQKQQPQNMPPQLKTSSGGLGKPQHFVQFDHSSPVSNDSIHQYIMSQPQLLQRSGSSSGQPQNDMLVENDPINNLIMQLSIQKNGSDGVSNSLPPPSNQDDDRTPSPWLDSNAGRLNPMIGGSGKMNMLQVQQSQNQKSQIISNLLISNMDLEPQNMHQGPPQSNHSHDLQHSSWNNNGSVVVAPTSSVSNKNTSIWDRLPDGGGNSMLHHQTPAKSMQHHIENSNSMSGGITEGQQNVFVAASNNSINKNSESESYHHPHLHHETHQSNMSSLVDNHDLSATPQEIEEINNDNGKHEFTKFGSNKKEEKTKKSSLDSITPNKKDFKKSASNDDFIVEKGKKSKKDKTTTNNQPTTSIDDVLINNGGTTTTTNNKSSNSKKATNEKTSATGLNNNKNNNSNERNSQTNSNSITKSVAPWSFAATPAATSQSPSLAEIQKSEMERRAEQYRYEQILREQQQQTMIGLAKANTNATFMWSGRNVLPKNIKSLAEIQAEEHAKQQEQYNNTNSGIQSAASSVSNLGGVGGSSNPLNYSRSNTSLNLNSSKLNKNDESGKVTFSALLNNNNWSVSAPNSGASSRNNSATSTNTAATNPNNLSVLGKFLLNYSSSPQGIWEEQTTKKSKQNMANTTANSLLQSHQNMSQSPHNQQSQQSKMMLQKSQSVANMPQTTIKLLQNNNSHNLIGGGDVLGGAGLNNNNNKSSYGNGHQINQSGHKSTMENDIASKISTASIQSKKDNTIKKELQSLGGCGGGGNSNEFINWCIKTLSNLTNTVDVPTFATFLQDIESPYEVKDYIKGYLGESREYCEFAKQFLERRSKYKNQQRAQNAHIDDMCQPAPAINPGTNDFQEIKGKGKKVKKNKMTKLDSRILGFSVTAAQDRINVGDRDYGDAS